MSFRILHNSISSVNNIPFNAAALAAIKQSIKSVWSAFLMLIAKSSFDTIDF
ncbi:MAG: hypothetical protein ACTSV5_00305 [Promethearchaeota archaeon]